MEVTASRSAAQLWAIRSVIRRISGLGQAGSMNSWVSCTRPMPTSTANILDEILGIGEAIDERVRAQRKRETHAVISPELSASKR